MPSKTLAKQARDKVVVSRSRILCRSLLSLLCAPAIALSQGAVDPADPVPEAGTPNNQSGFLQVYVNNVENLTGPDAPKCADNNPQALLNYIKATTHIPDIFIAQQINGGVVSPATKPAVDSRGLASTYAEMLSRTFGEEYGWVVSEDAPKTQKVPCKAAASLKRYQTNAIFYRLKRLQPAKKDFKATFQFRELSNCSVAPDRDDPEYQSRTVAVRAIFKDLKSKDRTVAVASLHWPTSEQYLNTEHCRIKNVDELDQQLRTGITTGANLYVAGGDLNQHDRAGNAPGAAWDSWYRWINYHLSDPTTDTRPAPGFLPYIDPIYDRCRRAYPTTNQENQLRTCLVQHHQTLGDAPEGNSRYDFLFARLGNGAIPKVSHADTVSWLDVGTPADEPYSEHRAVRSRIYYCSSPQQTRDAQGRSEWACL